MTVPSAQSVPESGKETGEYCRAHNFMAIVMRKDGFECCLRPGRISGTGAGQGVHCAAAGLPFYLPL